MADDRSNERIGNVNVSDSKTSDDGTGGQPIGGNDSNTGSGTTLTQGADLPADSANGKMQAQQDGSESSRDEGFIGSEKSGFDRDPINDEDEAEE
jgi:hypothetical protein